MEQTSIEQKLELIRTLRNEHDENMDKIKRREDILYPGHSYYNSYETSDKKELENTIEERKGSIFFKLRVLICIVLFLLFFFMDIKNYSVYSITSEKIVQEIGTTFNVNTIDFVKKFPYTLNIKQE